MVFITKTLKKWSLLWFCGCLYFSGLVVEPCSAFPRGGGGSGGGSGGREQTHHGKICKNIRVRCKLFVKRNYNDVKSDKSLILNNLYSIVKDDITNDILYYLKFYHLTNDDTASYFYIVF